MRIYTYNQFTSKDDVISICKARQSAGLSCRGCAVTKEACKRIKVKYGVKTPSDINKGGQL